MPQPSKEPCKKEACDIQACLSKNNFMPQRYGLALINAYKGMFMIDRISLSWIMEFLCFKSELMATSAA